MKASVIAISGTCCHKGCTRVSAIANKVSDFWVTRCEEHASGEITMDMDKIGIAVDVTKLLKTTHRAILAEAGESWQKQIARLV